LAWAGEEILRLSEELEAYRAGVAAWLNQAKKEVQAVQKLHKATETGNLRDLEKLRQAARTATDAAGLQAAECAPMEFDAGEYFASGDFLEEIKRTAEQEGVRLYERDGVVFCYPVLVRLEPEARAVRIDKRLEFNIHPKMLAALLKKEQSKEPRNKPEQFIETLFKTYEIVRSSDYKGANIDVPLKKVYDVLTLRPGSDKEYTLLDFTRDIYFLDKSGVMETKKGWRLSLPASTVSREGRGNILKFVTKDGHEKLYAGVKFTTTAKGE